LTLMIPARKIYGLQDLITHKHIDNMAKIILLTGTIVGYAYIMELFIAWYGGNKYEIAAFENRTSGYYWWAYYAMFFCNVISPQVFWFKYCRHNLWIVMAVCMCVNAGMWFERFVIIVTSIAQDFLPGAWDFYHPSNIEIWTFVGTFGLFLGLFLLFLRFLPVIAISEVKGVLPESDPHYLPPEAFTHDAEGNVLSHKGVKKKATKKEAKKATKKVAKKATRKAAKKATNPKKAAKKATKKKKT
ncbi:MAG: hypothetical protein VX588_10515, partial [Verrucomicrobiota bacterium]|nr:hypothetical protein [Verrucomicrobiota bacterium]